MKMSVTEKIKALFQKERTGKEKQESVSVSDGQTLYYFFNVSDKKMRAIHMAGCAVMAYVVHAEAIEINLEKCEAKITCKALRSMEAEMMIRYAGEGAELLVCGTGQMERMQKDFDFAAVLFKKVSSINRVMRHTEEFPSEEGIDSYVIAGKKYIQQEVTEALKAYKGTISYLASVLLKEKVLKTEEIRERIEAYVAGEAYDG